MPRTHRRSWRGRPRWARRARRASWHDEGGGEPAPVPRRRDQALPAGTSYSTESHRARSFRDRSRLCRRGQPLDGDDAPTPSRLGYRQYPLDEENATLRMRAETEHPPEDRVPTDMSYSLDTLAYVGDRLVPNPISGSWFVFCISRHHDCDQTLVSRLIHLLHLSPWEWSKMDFFVRIVRRSQRLKRKGFTAIIACPRPLGTPSCTAGNRTRRTASTGGPVSGLIRCSWNLSRGHLRSVIRTRLPRHSSIIANAFAAPEPPTRSERNASNSSNGNSSSITLAARHPHRSTRATSGGKCFRTIAFRDARSVLID
jgi:hypothetical protein